MPGRSDPLAVLFGHPVPPSASLQRLVDLLPSALYVCQAPDGIIRLYNRRAAELWGRAPRAGDSEERFCGSHRLYRPDGRFLTHAETPMAAALRGGGPQEDEVVIERPDGGRVTVRVNIAPLHDADGRVVGAVNVFQDVSDRRATEEALRVSEARYRAIVEDQPDLVCRFRAGGELTFVNEAYCRYFGRRREELVGRPYQPIVHPEDVPRVQALVASLSPAQPVVVIENRVVRADGALRWTQWTNRALHDPQGRLLEVQAAGRDVTERREAEDRVQAHVRTLEGLYRLAAEVGRARTVDQVCEAAVDAILTVGGADRASVLVFDEGGVMRFRAWRGLSAGYRAAVDGHSPWSAEAGDPAPIVVEDVREDPGLAGLRDVITAEGIRALGFIPIVHQGRLLGKFMVYYDGPHRFAPAELQASATIAHHVAFGLARAAAEAAIEGLLGRERAARREADAARAEAERANRAKDEFLAMLAHELRNPLSVVTNAVAVIGSAGPLPPESARAVGAIRRQAEHLGRLLDDLLDVARITSGRIELDLEPIDLRHAVELAVEAQRHRLDAKRQRLEVSLPERPVTVVGDTVRLQQVLGNLLNNASKYSPAGAGIRVALAPDGDHAVLRVRDSGIGIAPDKLQWVFELFAQASPTLARTEGGLGIGLTLVRRVVELHGGSVGASSPGPGRGAEFTVRLPLAAGPRPASVPAPAPPAVTPRRVLVIEDHEDGREMLAATLRLAGHQVLVAATGAEGLEVAAREAPEVALVDIGLPDLDGYTVGRALRTKLGEGLHLVAMTGYGQPEDRARSAAAGFEAHLVKPVEPARLVEVLERLA